jgi:hypothetical protein
MASKFWVRTVSFALDVIGDERLHERKAEIRTLVAARETPHMKIQHPQSQPAPQRDDKDIGPHPPFFQRQIIGRTGRQLESGTRPQMIPRFFGEKRPFITASPIPVWLVLPNTLSWRMTGK